jgi:hypothetical protein
MTVTNLLLNWNLTFSLGVYIWTSWHDLSFIQPYYFTNPETYEFDVHIDFIFFKKNQLILLPGVTNIRMLIVKVDAIYF